MSLKCCKERQKGKARILQKAKVFFKNKDKDIFIYFLIIYLLIILRETETEKEYLLIILTERTELGRGRE